MADCASLVVARENGFFAGLGLDVELRKAQSWAQIRDRLVEGEIDAAHMLITMPVQAALAAGPRHEPLGYAFTLSRHGNGIILANALWNAGARDPRGLAGWLSADPGRVLRLGVVFPRSTQEYFLRSWLALAGLEVGDRVVLTIIAPQEMVGRLRKGEIDGFCAGEPWSRRAAASKLGRLVAQSASYLPGLGEKVLGVRESWHRSHEDAHGLILRGLSRAAAWVADPANLESAVDLLAGKKYVNTPKPMVEGALRELHRGAGPDMAEGGVRFSMEDPDFPARSHAAWYLDQMVRWGHAGAEDAARVDPGRICLEDFHRRILSAGKSL